MTDNDVKHINLLLNDLVERGMEADHAGEIQGALIYRLEEKNEELNCPEAAHYSTYLREVEKVYPEGERTIHNMKSQKSAVEEIIFSVLQSYLRSWPEVEFGDMQIDTMRAASGDQLLTGIKIIPMLTR